MRTCCRRGTLHRGAAHIVLRRNQQRLRYKGQHSGGKMHDANRWLPADDSRQQEKSWRRDLWMVGHDRLRAPDIPALGNITSLAQRFGTVWETPWSVSLDDALFHCWIGYFRPRRLPSDF